MGEKARWTYLTSAAPGDSPPEAKCSCTIATRWPETPTQEPAGSVASTSSPDPMSTNPTNP